MDRVRRISEEIMEKYPKEFGTDFQANKEVLGRIIVVDSKMLRNRIAGYITKSKRRVDSGGTQEEEGREAEGAGQ